jgi:glycosyltransferase involved in cell wall biosynthesis
MRILLIGEYSRLHNSLKEGLTALGHEVTLVSDGDGFKRYPSDFSIAPSPKGMLNIIRQGLFRVFKYDISGLERGLRFKSLLPKLKGYDVVQLINEAPVKTLPSFEIYLIRKLMAQNGKAFLLCCGIDYTVVTYMLGKEPCYSVMNPYFENRGMHEYSYMLEYISKGRKKVHDFLYDRIAGVIASDMDYYLPLKNNPKLLGLLPNPVNIEKLNYNELVITDKIVVFLGINRINYNQKGIAFFEKALETLQLKYPDRVEIIISENLPYNEYIQLYDKAHILLDQVYAYDQGYNALEAMAKGKVVFTGAEKEFMEHYGLTEKVAVNALPNVEALVAELSFLIENPQEIIAIGKRAKAFIQKEHDHIEVAKKYIDIWKDYKSLILFSP